MPRRVGVPKPDGTRYIIPFASGQPVLLVGEAECRAVDADVKSGVMLEVQIPERHADDLLAALVDKLAADRIAGLQEAVRQLNVQLNEEGKKPKFTVSRDGEIEEHDVEIDELQEV
jgi:hypothetical protein